MTNKLYAISCMPLPCPKQTTYTYTELYKEYWDTVRRGLFRNTKDHHAAEDLAQETFLTVLKYFDNIDIRTVHSLLAVISSQLYFKWKRAVDNAPNFREDEDDPFKIMNDTFEESCNGLLDPLKIIQQDQFLSERFERIDKLQRVDQIILSKAFIEGIPMQEIAIDIGTSYANVRKRLQRMRKKLGDYNDEEIVHVSG
jgi:RNA polymerase sigma factor (sigma-70 family)